MFQLSVDKCHGMPRCKVDTDNFNVVIDQFDAQPFNLNDAGWIRNTIFELQRAQSKSEYDAIMSRLVEVASEGGISKGTSIEDAISAIKPRWAQSPAEIEQFVSMTNPVAMKRLDDAYRKVIKDGKIKEDVVVKDIPSASPSTTPASSSDV